MATIYDDLNNIKLEIELLENRWLEIDCEYEFQTWIPFKFELKTPTETISYSENFGATFNYDGLKIFISGLKKSCEDKLSEEFSRFEFGCLERYFELFLADPKEPELLEMTIWVNVGANTNGELFGYDRGVKFTVLVKDLQAFAETIEKELKCLLKK